MTLREIVDKYPVVNDEWEYRCMPPNMGRYRNDLNSYLGDVLFGHSKNEIAYKSGDYVGVTEFFERHSTRDDFYDNPAVFTHKGNDLFNYRGNSDMWGRMFKAYKNGDILDLTTKGVTTGNTRTVTMGASNTSFTIDVKETWPTTPSAPGATVTYKVAKRNAAEATKALRPSRYVKIDCSSAGTTGPFCLGFADVYQIRKIVQKSGSAPTSLTDGTDVTAYFILDNGQRDDRYELASIKKNGISLGASDYLLVEFDYFYPTYTGRSAFFTIDSYPIQDDSALATTSTIRTENIPVFVSPITAQKFDLRNHLDFRPVKSLPSGVTDSDAQSISTAPSNPSNTSTSYINASSGLKFPIPSTDLIFDYSYYIGRKDIVTVNKDGVLSITKGVPSTNPVVPDVLDTQMIISVLDIAPYPSLSPAYGNALYRRDLA